VLLALTAYGWEVWPTVEEDADVFDGRFRTGFETGLKPVGAKLSKLGITADHLTLLGVVMAAGAAVAIANGALRAGFLLLALSGINDMLDGAVAKASGTASPRGAFFDSVSDRLSDALLFGGVAWYLSSTEGGQIVLLPMAILAGAMLISYERAKAEALGYDARGGIMERAERFIMLGFGLLFDFLLIPILWLMLVLVVFTAGQRFVKVWRQASGDRPEPPRRATRRTARRASRRPSTSETWRRMRSRRQSQA
jgi:CDP-diacylglycerol--glycerol-3-phosphate 3-phosphatidyltransferase